MKYLKAVYCGMVLLTLHSVAWAQIYETKDAQGNPEFSDSPATKGAKVIELQQTNLVDAPQPAPLEQSPTEPGVVDQAPVQESDTVILHDGNDNNAVYLAPDVEAVAREREINRVDPAAPREVLDGEAPREIGDTDAQMPREVGDFPAASGAHRR